MNLIAAFLLLLAFNTWILSKNAQELHLNIEEMGLGEAYNHLMQTAK